MRLCEEVINSYISISALQIVPTHRISYLEFGDHDNGEVVLCVHGLSRNAHDFDFLAQKLSEQFRVIAIDMPGRGGSEWFEDAKYYNYHTYVHDIRRFIKSLGLKSVHFIGTSMGGLIGMALATYYPHLIKTLVINDVGPELPRSSISRMEKYFDRNISFNMIDEAYRFFQMSLKNFGINSDQHWDHVVKYGVLFSEENKKYILHYDNRILKKNKTYSDIFFRQSDFINLWHIWKNIRCDILLIRGARSDILLQDTVDKMMGIRFFDIHIVRNAGHAPSLFDEEEIYGIYLWMLKHI